VTRGKVIRWIVVLALVAAGLILLNGIRRWISLDQCWDSGGAWDYQTEECNH